MPITTRVKDLDQITGQESAREETNSGDEGLPLLVATGLELSAIGRKSVASSAA